MFSSAISASTLGIAEGALAAFLAYTRKRVTIVGSRAAEDPHQLSSLGEAADDLDASRTHLPATMDRMYDNVLAGKKITIEECAEARRNQVRASRRATDAVDEFFRRAGGGPSAATSPFSVTGAHAAMNHLCNVPDSIYKCWSRDQFGLPVKLRVLVRHTPEVAPAPSCPRPTAPAEAGEPRQRPRPLPLAGIVATHGATRTHPKLNQPPRRGGDQHG
ncbi:acyl-CoA dehydrogenase family protein [Streptomyces avermitilis]|uniref:hypothetical protein n=1 Tax=Streptomyces avermitilis TaxID=33903 RepID=UPI00367C07AB